MSDIYIVVASGLYDSHNVCYHNNKTDAEEHVHRANVFQRAHEKEHRRYWQEWRTRVQGLHTQRPRRSLEELEKAAGMKCPYTFFRNIKNPYNKHFDPNATDVEYYYSKIPPGDLK